jgi:hypothetical protein
MQERMSSPYSKCSAEASAMTVGSLLTSALASHRDVATRHNRLGLTEPLDPSPRRFHDRPYLVLDADRFVAACLAAMADRDLASLPAIGAIDQFVDSTDVLGFRPSLCRQVGRVYDLAAGRSAQGLA